MVSKGPDDKYFIDYDKYDVTLYFGDVRVKIGAGENIDEKFSKMKNILPRLEGKKGVLQMEHYILGDIATGD